MMRIWLFALLTLSTLIHADSITAPLIDLEGNRASIEADHLRVGMSGVVIRDFDSTHSSIIANAYVEQLNNRRAFLRLSPYDGLYQENLPTGNWKSALSDRVVIASDYQRALLIAPNDHAYHSITKSMPSLVWIHPDNYATHLSHEGHSTPLTEDFHQYCTANAIGLLYIQSSGTLFTLDCKTFALLEHTPSLHKEESQVPFYSRIPKIRSAWWGEGSSQLESYEPYYLELIALNNAKNKELYELYKAKFSEKSALLRYFEIKE